MEPEFDVGAEHLLGEGVYAQSLELGDQNNRSINLDISILFITFVSIWIDARDTNLIYHGI